MNFFRKGVFQPNCFKVEECQRSPNWFENVVTLTLHWEDDFVINLALGSPFVGAEGLEPDLVFSSEFWKSHSFAFDVRSNQFALKD